MARAEAGEPEIIHHDADLLVLHKPPGLPTTAPTTNEPSLVRWVSERFPELRAHATSRLDSPVSGLVTFALNREANQHLLDARESGTYERIYLGIAIRDLAEDAGRWDWPISIDPRDPKHRRAGAGRGEREAMTLYEVVARRSGAMLLRLMPKTGRTHQLRVHAAEAGVPLFGDPAYGGERRVVLPGGAVVTARRVMLHCARVSFPSPSGPERIVLDAAARADMQTIWQTFGGAASELQP